MGRDATVLEDKKTSRNDHIVLFGEQEISPVSPYSEYATTTRHLMENRKPESLDPAIPDPASSHESNYTSSLPRMDNDERFAAFPPPSLLSPFRPRPCLPHSPQIVVRTPQNGL